MNRYKIAFSLQDRFKYVDADYHATGSWGPGGIAAYSYAPTFATDGFVHFYKTGEQAPVLSVPVDEILYVERVG